MINTNVVMVVEGNNRNVQKPKKERRESKKLFWVVESAN